MKWYLARSGAAPKTWWYLSFVKDGAFAGGCVVEAVDMGEAVKRAWTLKINPGGEVMGIPVPEAALPQPNDRDRLLTKDEIKSIWPDAEKLGDIDDALN